MEQIKLGEGRLLDYEGNLNDSGYNTYLSRAYRRSDIIGLKSRIKEWDYYAVLTKDYGICLTISDCSMFSLVSVTTLDFAHKEFTTKTDINFFTFGKLNLPSTSVIGDLIYKKKNFKVYFYNDGNVRHLKGFVKNFKDKHDLDFDLILNETSKNSMVIATPFKKKKHFYYNQKINNLVSNGYFKIGPKLYSIKDGLGVLDWGRGVWTYSNTWYWASLSTKDKDGYKGFNLGYGFGNNDKATENMVFLNNEAYKLDDVKFLFTSQKNSNKIDFLKKIVVTSSDKSVDLTFTPILDRHDNLNAVVIASNQHQVFGVYNGKIKVEDKIITFKDAIGFLEKVKNRW